MEYVITFKSTNFAIKAEQCLLEQKLQPSVLPLPSQISAGCGICLRVNQEEIKPALEILADRNIDEIGLFSRVMENKQFSYTEVKTGVYEMEKPSPVNPSNGFAVVISKNTMGEGAEELGKILIKAYIYSLTELPVPPKFVIFLNSGAYLTSDGSNAIDDLKKLENEGTEILTCGTCVNYYGLQDKLAVGAITNMYAIAEKMAGIAKLINI